MHKILWTKSSIFPPICSVAENIIFKARKVKTSLYRLCRNRLCINHSDLGSYSALLPWGRGDGWRVQWYMAALLLGCVEGYKEEGRGAKAFCTTSRWSLTGWLDFVWGNAESQSSTSEVANPIRVLKIPEEHVFGISSYKINKHNHFGEMVFLTLIQTYHTVWIYSLGTICALYHISP